MAKYCSNCESTRIMSVTGKTSDMFGAICKDKEMYNQYVPYDIGIGGGDYMEFEYCLDCGRIQGKFPISEEVVNKAFEN